jgi:hypothetical protein
MPPIGPGQRSCGWYWIWQKFSLQQDLQLETCSSPMGWPALGLQFHCLCCRDSLVDGRSPSPVCASLTPVALSRAGPEQCVKPAVQRGMVNARVVNGGTRYFAPPRFCESFAVFGRIPRFQNPFKYICNSRINHDTVHFCPCYIVHPQKLIQCYQVHKHPVKLPERRIAYNGGLRESAPARPDCPKIVEVRLTMVESRAG